MGKTVCHQIPSCNLTSLGENSASLDNLKSICLFWKWWFSSSQTVPSSLLSSDVVAGPWEVGPLGLRRRSLTKDSVFFWTKKWVRQPIWWPCFILFPSLYASLRAISLAIYGYLPAIDGYSMASKIRETMENQGKHVDRLLEFGVPCEPWQ